MPMLEMCGLFSKNYASVLVLWFPDVSSIKQNLQSSSNTALNVFIRVFIFLYLSFSFPAAGMKYLAPTS